MLCKYSPSPTVNDPEGKTLGKGEGIVSSTGSAGKTGNPQLRKMKLEPYFTLDTKTTSKWIKT